MKTNQLHQIKNHGETHKLCSILVYPFSFLHPLPMTTEGHHLLHDTNKHDAEEGGGGKVALR